MKLIFRSLSLQNFTEPSTFNCVARNPLGAANWTIQLEMLQDLRPDWLSKIVRPEVHNGQLLLHFPDSLPDSLRRPNQWTLRYSDDPSKEKILWSVLESEDRPLTVKTFSIFLYLLIFRVFQLKVLLIQCR